MANKDHSLDDKIIKAAFDEFMEYGFQKASINQIAKRAGLTTGAIYTRYKNKDALFCSLVSEVIAAMREQAAPLRDMYDNVRKSGDLNAFLTTASIEKRNFLELLFQYYDECVLFFCRSAGSSIGSMMEQMIERKAAETVMFFKELAKKEINFDSVELIITEQFYFYQQILEKGYSKERAISCMEAVETFFVAGWKDLFEKMR